MAMIETRDGFSQSLGTTTIGTQFPRVTLDNFNYSGEDEATLSELRAEIKTATTVLATANDEYDTALARYNRRKTELEALKKTLSSYDDLKWCMSMCAINKRIVAGKVTTKEKEVADANALLMDATNKKQVAEGELFGLNSKLELLIIEFDAKEASEKNLAELEEAKAELATAIAEKELNAKLEEVVVASTAPIVEPEIAKANNNKKYINTGLILIVILGTAFILFRKKK